MVAAILNEARPFPDSPSIRLTWFDEILSVDHAKFRTNCKNSLRIAFERDNGAPERTIGQEVVGAQDNEVIATCEVNTFIERCYRTKISVMADDFNPTILCSKAARHLQAVVGRVIVNYYNAKVVYLLRKRTAYTLREVPSRVVARYNDIDARHQRGLLTGRLRFFVG